MKIGQQPNSCVAFLLNKIRCTDDRYLKNKTNKQKVWPKDKSFPVEGILPHAGMQSWSASKNIIRQQIVCFLRH
jgi:hypothetical protein